MTLTLCLLLYGLVVSVAGPPVLARLTRRGIAPQLGIAAWSAAMAVVILTWTGAAIMLVTEAVHWNRDAHWVSACVVEVLRSIDGRAAALLQGTLIAVSAVAAAVLPLVVWRAGRGMLRMRTHTLRHARTARVIGQRLPGTDAVVVDTADRLAYCVAGRPKTIVITTGALDALVPDQLGAVLAHERAHLIGRHHLLLASVRGLAAAAPWMRLFRDGATEIALLLEMCADDSAARSHGRRALLGGLLALTGSSVAPAGALGASGGDVLARAHRLTVAVSTPVHVRARTLLSLIVLSITASPIAFGALAAAGVIMCGPMGS